MRVELTMSETILEQTRLRQVKGVNKDAIVAHQRAVNILKQQGQYQDSIKILCAQASKKYRTEHAKVQLKKQIQRVQGFKIKHILKQD